MRRSLGQKLKTLVRLTDLVDLSPSITPGPNPDVPYEGSEGQQVVVSEDGTQIEFIDQNYDLVCYYSGTPSNSQVVLQFTFPTRVQFAAGLGNSQATAGTAPAGAQEFSIQKNGVEVGTINFAGGATSGTFTMATATTYAVGDIMKIVAPASVDGSIANIGITLDGAKKVKG